MNVDVDIEDKNIHQNADGDGLKLKKESEKDQMASEFENARLSSTSYKGKRKGHPIAGH